MNETLNQGLQGVETILKSNYEIETRTANNNKLQITEHLSDISNQITDLAKRLNIASMVNCKYINLTDFQAYFDESSSEFYFRILIIDTDKSVYENQLKDKDDLFKAIAFASWSLIVDLNPQSDMIKEL